MHVYMFALSKAGVLNVVAFKYTLREYRKTVLH